jgi:putative polyketide hydroxylase
MRTGRTETTPVLVVGAGPAGLVAAITLARYGIPSLLVERRADSSSLPRATLINLRTMELLRSWGLEPAVRATAMDVLPRGLLTETLATPGTELPFGYPTAEEAAPHSPTYPAIAPQDDLEPILLDHLTTYPAASVRLGTELFGLQQDATGVTAQIRDVATGETSAVHARYLIGADGAHSAVRNQLGIGMEGPDQLGVHTTALFRAPLWHVAGERRYGLYAIMHPEASGVLLPAGRGDRWLYAHELAPDSPPGTDSIEEMLRRIRIATAQPDLRPRIERTGSFSFAAQVADRFREGRAFLVGDAAHRVTPRGGSGMNTAIYDGFDLGWKLAWVLSGWSGAALLDSYVAERGPVGVRNVARSARIDGSGRSLADGIAEDLDGRVAHAWVPRNGTQVSTLDVVGEGFTVLTGPDGATWRQAVADARSTVPMHAHELDETTAQAVGVEQGGAALIRPDGRVMARWDAMEHFRTSALRIGMDAMIRPLEALSA